MIYGKVSKRVMSQMDRSGTEDLGITARLMYGYILSNTSVLSPSESSYVLLAALIPQDVRAFVPALQADMLNITKGQPTTQRTSERLSCYWFYR